MKDVILTILLGFLGYYRFRKKQIGLGVLYIFTCGLFYVGYVIDIIKSVKDYNNSQKLENTDKNILEEANVVIDNYKSILDNAKNIIDKYSAEATDMYCIMDNPKEVELFYNPYFEKLPNEVPYSLKKIHKKIDSEYKTLAQFKYFYFNNEQQCLGFLYFNSQHTIVESPKILYSEIKSYELLKDESVDTKKSSVGIASINNISSGSAFSESVTRTTFHSGSLILKTTNIKNPIVSIKIYNIDDFNKIKAHMELIKGE